MNCKHCGEPVSRCPATVHATGCAGWVHAHNGAHLCYAPRLAEPDLAEPEPGQPSRPIHLITAPDFSLACGHDGHDKATTVAAAVTCQACRNTPAFGEVA